MKSKLVRPKSVPGTLAEEVWNAGANPPLEVIDPDLLEAAKAKPKDMVRLPSEVIERHVSDSRQNGASQAQIDIDVNYLVDLFEEAYALRKNRQS